MNNDNTVKIGVALKWRNTFDTTKRYYQENVVTACGCVFRCKVLQAQGKSPIRFTDEQGHIAYTNTDIWDVLVDMAYYYNYTVDTRKLTKEMLDYAAKLDALFQKQQKEIEAIQADDKDQWKHIKDIEDHNVEQQRELNSLHDTFSCFSEGIWFDTLLWSDVTIWDNNKYAITDDLQDQINELTETHHQDIKDLTDKLNSEISALTAHVAQRERYQDGINDYLQDQVFDLNNALSCFSSGIWDNDLHWSQEALWDNNKYAITDALAEELETLTANHNQDVKNINAHLLTTDQNLAKAVLQNTSEHRLVNDRLSKHDEEIEALQILINEHDQQILDLVETLTCYSYGQWDDGLKWGDSALWENSNQMCDTFDDIYRKIADHQKSIDELSRKIVEIKLESPTAQIEALEQKIITENRKTAYQIRAIGREQEAQNIDIARLGEHFCCFSDGVWGDLFVWGNDLKWANQSGVVNDALDELRGDVRSINQKIEDANEDIMTNLALIRANHQLIEDNIEAIQENQEAIADTQKNHKDDVKALRNEALTEHRQVAYQLRAIGREQIAQNEEITKLGEHFNCFADGVWCNLFSWENERLWANESGVIICALEEIHEELDSHQATLDSLIKEKDEHFSCFHDDVWCNSSLWNDGHLWPCDFSDIPLMFNKQGEQLLSLQNSANETHAILSKELSELDASLGDMEEKVAAHEGLIKGNQELIKECLDSTASNSDRIHNLDSEIKEMAEGFSNDLLAEHRQVAYQIRAIYREQEAQNYNIAQIGSHFDCLADGVWGNHFLWNNDQIWTNGPGMIKEAIGDIVNELNSQKEILDSILDEQNEHFTCFSDDAWCNLSVWDNGRLWPSGSLNLLLAIEKNEAEIRSHAEAFESFQEQTIEEVSNIYDSLNQVDENLSDIEISQRHLSDRTTVLESTLADTKKHVEENSKLIQKNQNLIGIVDEKLAETSDEVFRLNSEIEEQTEAIRDEILLEHRSVAYQLRAISREQGIQDENIAQIGSHFSCYADGIWGNHFLWGDDSLWANAAGVVKEALDDINIELDRHQETLNLIMEEQAEHFTCFGDDVWCNSSVWDDGRLWPSGFAEFTQAIEKCEAKIQTLNQSVVSLKAQTESAVSKINTTLTQIGDDVSEISTSIDLCGERIEQNAEGIQNNAGEIQSLKNHSASEIESLRQEAIAEHRNIAYQLRAIGRDQLSQDERLCQLGEHFGCFVDGQWGNLFLWNNEHQWHNQTGVIVEALTDIHLELDEIQENLANTMEETSEHFNCFGEGYWCNVSVWDEECSWSNGTHELGELYVEHRADVKKLQTRISDIDSVVKEHSASIAAQQTTHKEDLKTLRQEIGIRTKNVDETLDAIQTTQQSHQEIIDDHTEKLDELWEGRYCFDEGRWNNAFLWNEIEIWLNSSESLKEVESEVMEQDARISALESQFKLFLQQYAAQQTIIEQQQEQLETLMDCFTVLNVGKWQNLLLWDNNSKWSNELITEAANTVGTGGSSTVAVKSYDSRTATVTI